MGLDKNTLVIFSSDNGPANYAPARIAGSTAGLKGRKTDVFQGGVDVPCIMYWPGHLTGGKVDKTTVLSTVDLLPTFAELAKTTLPNGYMPDGESFAAIFDNKPFKRTKPLFWEWRFPYYGDDAYRQDSWVSIAVRDGDWKLLADDKRKRIELYNIPTDVFEKQNMAKTNPEIVKELLAKWDKWKSQLPK